MLRWWVVYVGTRGAGMFAHKDRHRTASWQLQLSGAKRWRLCPPSEVHEREMTWRVNGRIRPLNHDDGTVARGERASKRGGPERCARAR